MNELLKMLDCLACKYVARVGSMFAVYLQMIVFLLRF